ncbi:MAG: DUF11 domain-containing protein, partial [Tannerella sp.]|nr:DUF11 domain-containing protein [Tannerella sp.]
IADIVAARYHSDNANKRLIDGYYIYWGSNRNTPTFVATHQSTFCAFGAAMARVPLHNISNDTIPLIITVGYDDGLIYAYNALTGAQVWSSTASSPLTGYNATASVGYSLQFVDFNGDGYVEILAANKIFDAATGALVLEMSSANTAFSYHAGTAYQKYEPIAADFTGDGIPEYAAGNEVYSVNINTHNSTSGNSYNLIASVSAPTIGGFTVSDGPTAVADINRDGRLDVFVKQAADQSNIRFYAWDVQTESIIATGQTTTTGFDHSTPFIGNVDNDPELEVLFVTTNKINGFRYDGSSLFDKVYEMTIIDGSGATGITLFDFNQDGVSELVYRDEDTLRIMNAVPATLPLIGTFHTLYSTPGGSGTCYEYPIVLDVDGDNGAEVVSVSGAGKSTTGSLRIYESGSDQNWAPARPVWNQYAYNVVNVNSDLTIPRRYFSPASFFEGSDGVTGTNDDIQPFNSFLQQATALNLHGEPLWLLPDVEPVILGNAYGYYADGDSLVVHVSLTNRGDAALVAPFYLAAYRNTVTVGNNIAVDSVQTTLNAGDTLTATLTLRNLSAYLPFDSVIIRINDRGQATYVQEECDSSSNSLTFNLIIARNDYYTTIVNNPVLAVPHLNDSIPAGAFTCSYSAPLHGTAMTVGVGSGCDSILYTPATDFLGVDTIVYTITQNGVTATALIIITVNEKPDNIVDSTCFTTPPAMNWSISASYSNEHNLSPYQSPIVGDLDGDGIPEILTAYGLTNGQVGDIFRPADGIAIYKGDDITAPPVLVTAEGKFSWDFRVKYGIVKTRINNRDTTLIVIAEGDRYLRAYNSLGVKVWTSSAAYHATLNNGIVPTFADFNADGIPEIAIAGNLFNSVDGTLLCSIPAGCPFIDEPYGRSTTVIAADVFNSGKLNYVMGTDIYDVNVNSSNQIQSLTLHRRLMPPTDFSDDADYPYGSSPLTVNSGTGGRPLLVDFDRDGRLDMLVAAYSAYSSAMIYIADPATGAIKAKKYIPQVSDFGYPFVGDIDAQPDQLNEILLIKGTSVVSERLIMAFKFVPDSAVLKTFWTLTHTDASNCTGITMFDFDQDGTAEIVYRDETLLRIIDGSANSPYPNRVKASFPNYSGTSGEYPVVADVDNDGHAEIVIVGGLDGDASYNILGRLWVFKSSDPESPWAPTRKVWNQYVYHPTMVNNDLSIPPHPASPAVILPGADGIIGTGDDVQPYNNFLQQQTELSSNGTPLWLTPDMVFQSVDATRVGDSVRVTVCFENLGDAMLGSPTYLTYYRDSISAASQHKVDSVVHLIEPGADTCKVTMLSAFPAFAQLVIRLNDRGFIGGASTYPVQTECHYEDSISNPLNPALSLYMKKRAWLNSETDSRNGTYPNPVAVLYRDSIKYEITAVNANIHAGTTLIVRDTIPAYLDTVSRATWSSPLPVVTIVSGTPARKALEWTLPNLAVGETRTVSFYATPEAGSVASQPLFVNWAHVLASDTLLIRGDTATYHQGAGVAVVTFAASAGGMIFGELQAVDYSTAARAAEVLIVPDSGYVFVGWSHPAYLSLRGQTVPATEGVFNLDTLLIYGNVELTAVFLSESLTSSETITIGAERERLPQSKSRIWSVNSEIFVHPASVPSVLRIYSTDGVLIRQQTILSKDVTAIKMPAGVYIANINSSIGTKVIISRK